MYLAIEKIMTINKPRVAYAIRLKDPEGNYYSLIDRIKIGRIGDTFIDRKWIDNVEISDIIDTGCLHVSPYKKYLISELEKGSSWKEYEYPYDFEVIIKAEIPTDEKIYVGRNYRCSRILDNKLAWGCRTYKILEEVYVKNE